MNEEKSSGFKIRFDEETEEPASQPEVKDLRVEKLNRKVTIITIIIPILTIVILGVTYVGIKKRVDNMQDTGTTKVQNLSEGLDSKFSALSLQYAKLEETLGKKIEATETALVSLKDALNRAEKSIKAINAAKAEKKEVDGAIAKIDEAIAPLRKDLESSSSEIKNLELTFTNQLAPIAETVTTTTEALNKLKKDIAAFSSNTIDDKKLGSALQNERKNYQQKLSQLTANFEDKILSLENKITELEKIIELSEAPPPPPGKIIEQDIQPKTP
jgi:chromosome segregation ATPase